MHKQIATTFMLITLLVSHSWGQVDRRGTDRPRRGTRQTHREARFQTDVPDHPVDVILARPTDNTMTLSALFYADARFYIAYGERPGKLTARTELRRCQAGQPVEVVIDSLKTDTQYHYELREAGSDEVAARGMFHTQRPPGSDFIFTVQADSHLDEGANAELYARTLTSTLADQPDFHVDLGDTFMVDKYRDDYHASAKQYLAQRYYFGLLCHSAPLFLVLGNHDGECGWRGRRGANDMAAWSNQMRKKYFPNPQPDGIYSGNEIQHEDLGLLEDYYAWKWGDALFVVLDPYWYTTQKSRQSHDGWAWTLGQTQYRWLRRTLEGRRARFKFVFIHHLVGGGDRNARGGVEVAKYYEWGGRGPDGSDDFAAQRPGWAKPIHELLRANDVNVVFHGHDHFFAKQKLDGIIYQLVPQPGHPRSNATRMAREYGYVSGDFVDGSGHLRVTVSESKVTIDFMRTKPGADRSGGRDGAERAYSYTVDCPS